MTIQSSKFHGINSRPMDTMAWRGRHEANDRDCKCLRQRFVIDLWVVGSRWSNRTDFGSAELNVSGERAAEGIERLAIRAGRPPRFHFLPYKQRGASRQLRRVRLVFCF